MVILLGSSPCGSDARKPGRRNQRVAVEQTGRAIEATLPIQHPQHRYLSRPERSVINRHIGPVFERTWRIELTEQHIAGHLIHSFLYHHLMFYPTTNHALDSNKRPDRHFRLDPDANAGSAADKRLESRRGWHQPADRESHRLPPDPCDRVARWRYLPSGQLARFPPSGHATPDRRGGQDTLPKPRPTENQPGKHAKAPRVPEGPYPANPAQQNDLHGPSPTSLRSRDRASCG